MCSELIIKTPERRQWRRSGVFIVNFEHISHLVLVFLLLNLIAELMVRPLYNGPCRMNSQENTCDSVGWPTTLFKKTWLRVFSVDYTILVRKGIL